jgi:hypothetical protein
MGDQSGSGREFSRDLPREARQINSADIEEFAQAAFTGVLRAIEARGVRADIVSPDDPRKILPGPIVWGIWLDPREETLRQLIEAREIPPRQ